MTTRRYSRARERPRRARARPGSFRVRRMQVVVMIPQRLRRASIGMTPPTPYPRVA
jgi:hypothetical protein